MPARTVHSDEVDRRFESDISHGGDAVALNIRTMAYLIHTLMRWTLLLGEPLEVGGRKNDRATAQVVLDVIAQAKVLSYRTPLVRSLQGSTTCAFPLLVQFDVALERLVNAPAVAGCQQVKQQTAYDCHPESCIGSGGTEWYTAPLRVSYGRRDPRVNDVVEKTTCPWTSL